MPSKRIRSRAPLRISFCGGGTDVLPYAAECGGVVLNATIDRYAYATLVSNGSRELIVRSLDYNLTSRFDLEQPPVYDGKLDLVKAAFKWICGQTDGGGVGVGCELSLHTDAPPGSGLGSSSAVVVAMLHAFATWRHVPLTAYELARLAYVLEREELGIKGGMQDQYAATFGGFNFIEFSASGVVVNPLRISSDTLNELQYCLVLCYTGGTRLSSGIIDAQVSNYQAGHQEPIEAMQQLKALTVAMKNAVLKGALNEFGALLHDAWTSKKKMSDQISTPLLDDIYQEARRSGALGGKVSGAGGGGYMYFFCPAETRHRVSARLEEMGLRCTRFSFEPLGVQAWECGTYESPVCEVM
ncbi:MAG: GHMP kinase [Acidobacteria bacterium]|nr:GHMP kinase [Acidobacteriota bacterium]